MNKDELLQEIDGERPNADQAARLMDLAMGDTSAFLLDGGAPNAAAEAASTTTDNQAPLNTDQTDAGNKGAADDGGKAATTEGKKPDEAELNADNAVILAKDGKHTIGFEKLVEARQGMAHWKSEAEAKDARIAELEAQASAREKAGEAPTTQDNQLKAAQAAIDAGVNPELFGDFSEEALAKGIQTLVQQQVEQQVGAALKPYQEKEARSAADAHTDSIYAAHPDADSVFESREFAEWLQAQPSVVRGAYQSVLDPKTGGTAAQVIEVFDEFKKATAVAPPNEQKPNPQDAKAAAQEALKKAAAAPPASLTDIPGGKPATGNKFEALAAMDPTSMSDALGKYSPEQIEEFLNRTM